ncbi:Short-chain dehydrogenase reductase family [Mycena venus]|uniref:Short-chain dehydrogenase reductase family n=1 Tax=Mycena venus TaxID=2733690 RepID=A0A8H7D7F3_9AGAR|nr:Short-chain dehydrogenase reductase family [Mycena venus]
MVFNPASDIPDLENKVIFITGGTAGLGKESILALAKKKPAHIFFTGRDEDRAASLVTEVKTATPSAQLTFLKCNMLFLASVVEVAKQLASETDRLDLLMCNAGIFTPAPGLTEDGYEIVFGANHVAHALFIKLLLPTLLRTTDARVVIMTSRAFRGASGIPFTQMRDKQSGLLASKLRYPHSKLANLLYAGELARRYPNITTVSVHPGVANTDMLTNAPWLERNLIAAMQMWNREPIVAPDEGAHTQLWAATVNKSELVNGGYYEPVGVQGQTTKQSMDTKLAEELWNWTEKELQGYQA